MLSRPADSSLSTVFDDFGFLAGALPLEPAVRSVLFGQAHFEQHGHSLAASHEIAKGAAAHGRFFPRLKDNIENLRKSRNYLERHANEGHYLGPAAFWLLDNAALIEEQLYAIHKGLPKNFFGLLPRLRDEPLAGLPRIYSVAWAWVAHSDSGFNAVLLESYLRAYQAERELTLAELWALPTTLRVVLVENLRRLAERVATQQAARDAAHHWFDGPDQERTIARLTELESVVAVRGVTNAFLLQLEQRAEELPPDDERKLADWLITRLSDPIGSLARQQSETTEDQQSIRNAITTLRQLDRFKWQDIFSRTNRVMQQLTLNPVFAAETEESQQATLNAIERLARKAKRTESSVAASLLEQTAKAQEANALEATPAYWWKGPGKPRLHRELGLASTFFPSLDTPDGKRALAIAYLCGLAVCTLAITNWLLSRHSEADVSNWLLSLFALLLLGPVSEAVVAVFNRIISESVKPARLLRYALKDGITESERTIVVIPCMLTESSIQALCAQLEQHYLANPERNTQFALLSDWTDADSPVAAADQSLLSAARYGVEELNIRYPGRTDDAVRFLLLHRARVWSQTEARYIGWERKRGKLAQLIHHLAAPGDSPFIPLGNLSICARGTRYIVTLDSDTGMPPGRLRELVGIANHPFNRARLDDNGMRVVGGYGIIQPRLVTPLPLPETLTGYHQLFSGECGIDPYSAASSEIYQDVFAEGTFTGKGLFDVQALHATLHQRLPEEQILSHDLLEGSIVRCAAVSDITFIEDAPVHPDVAASRLHRWVRGDWQLLPFLFRPHHHNIALINRWKMVDNLRRSLVAPASLLLIVLSVCCDTIPVIWTLGVVAAAFSAGPLMGAIAGLAPERDDIALRLFYRHALAGLGRAAMLALWHLAQLLQLAMMYSDAIARALYRQFVSHRHLLEWTTAATAQAAARTDLRSLLNLHYRVPLAALLILLGFAMADFVGAPVSWPAALALTLLWSLTAVWTWLVSHPRLQHTRELLREEDRSYLYGLARDTWRFYERYVTASDNHLPPDNVQMQPHTMVAHRTSPTNIGLYLTATASAHRLGFIGISEMAERLELTMNTLDRMPRFRGHLFNWYDTQTLNVLQPAYVSTVDSGNCSGHLLAVARACEEAAEQTGNDVSPRIAICHAAVRLRALRPLLRASPHLRTTALLIERDIQWPVAISDVASLQALLQAAQAELEVQLALRAGSEDSRSLWELQDYVVTLVSLLRDRQVSVEVLCARLDALATRARKLALEADYAMLYDPRSRLLHIGYRADTEQLDANYYDLLASEARLTSLLAIAKGDVPARHWAALGRPFYSRGKIVGLKSWSGSMFEYLMPSLLLDEPIGSVLQQVVRSAVEEQIAEANGRHTPWGISESAIAAQDHTLAYQYGPQGVARLALRRTPADERVIAPYATALALVVAPGDAIANLRALEQLQARHVMGFIEALDFTPQRQSGKQAFTPVHTFMAHHQAMSLLAITDVLTEGAQRNWAMSDPHLRAVTSLLHEKAPLEVPLLAETPPLPPARRHRNVHLVFESSPLKEALPATQLLTNGRYGVLLRSNGSGCSRLDGVSLTRWRDDVLRDAYGIFIYMQRSGNSGPFSLTAHPAPDVSAKYECHIQPDRVVFDATWPDVHARTSVWVSPEDDCEMRQIELSNKGKLSTELTISIYAEVCLSPQNADEAHPAFANLFVQAAWDAGEQALYLRRQPRLSTETSMLSTFFLASAAGDIGSVGVCTDRARWLGRYGSLQQPVGEAHAVALPDSASEDVPLPGVPMDTGLDPVAVISVRVRLPPNGNARLTFCAAASRELETLEALVDKYRQGTHVQRASNMSHTMAAIRLREQQYDPDQWSAMLSINTLLTSHLTRDVSVYSRTALRGPLPRCDKRVLWRHGISGDKPVLLVHISDESGIRLVQALKKALRDLTESGFSADLVVINAEPASYMTPVQYQLQILSERFLNQVPDSVPADRRSTLHILKEQDLGVDERYTLNTLARVRLNADDRPLAVHVSRLIDDLVNDAKLRHQIKSVRVPPVLPPQQRHARTAPPEGEFIGENGDFRFTIDPAVHPSRPWVHILANPGFGCHISEIGGGYTWASNSRMHQLTSWSNDPLSDPAGEHLLLQDLDRGTAWSLGRGLSYGDARRIEYGMGYARMHQRIEGLEVALTWCVDTVQAIKQVQVSITDKLGQPRRLRLVTMAEWMMGSDRRDRLSVQTQAHQLVVGQQGVGLPAAATITLLQATQLNHSAGFGEACAFMLLRESQAGDAEHTAFKVAGGARGNPVVPLDWTCDRREFFDMAGRLIMPARLGQRDGPGLDPCAALACVLSTAASGSVHVSMLLGHARSPEESRQLAAQAWHVDPALRLRRQCEQWPALLGGTRVSTPDSRFDALVNHWLPYQTLVCRMWARAGFYQAGGAFGYRDQLQDAMALVTRSPAILAQQIRVNAARQFAEGDVQHWWHEPGGAGVRTHFSDDRLWLPLALALYVERTNDHALLDEQIPFLQGAAVPVGAEDIYESPERTDWTTSIFEHAARAIDRSLNTGTHDLPLFGTGDWNDGMNRVGHQGRGESVWLAWFLCSVVEATLPLAASRNETTRVTRWSEARKGWQQALELHGWDGAWYRRGFFDDGSPLGSASNKECRIDLIAQAWAMLSGAGPIDRAHQAMEAARTQLFDDEANLIRLLTPALRHAEPAAGYIQAYPAGVRENGGQYNHAAVWGLMAFAKMGDADMAWRTFTALSPAHRWSNAEQGPRYAIEPYVMAGDIYTVAPRVGHGGWSWYTGSAGWLMRAAVESICGVVVQGDTVLLQPCLPPHWPQASVSVRRGEDYVRFTLCANEAQAQSCLDKDPDAIRVTAGERVNLTAQPPTRNYIVMDQPPARGIGKT